MRTRRSTVQRKAAAIALSLRTDIICPIDQMNSYPESSNNLDLKQYTIDHVLDGIYWCDEQARILDVNDSACKMVGYSREELTSMTVAQLDLNFSIETWPARWDFLKKQGSVTFETLHRHKDGRVITVEITANFISYNGRELHCDFVRDITERKHADEALRIAAITFDTQEAILITDPDAKILRVNQAFHDITGYHAEEVIGQNPRIFQSGRHDGAFFQAMWSALLDTGKWSG